MNIKQSEYLLKLFWNTAGVYIVKYVTYLNINICIYCNITIRVVDLKISKKFLEVNILVRLPRFFKHPCRVVGCPFGI